MFLTQWESLFDLDRRALRESLQESQWAPLVDIKSDEKKYTIEIEAPGVNQKDFDVQVQENVLTIKAEKKSEKNEEKENFHHVERVYGSFERAFTLPEDAQASDIQAEYKSGVLVVSILRKKSKEKLPKQITVKAA